MFKKKKIIFTSIIITLILSNTSSVYAEEQPRTEPDENQTIESKTLNTNKDELQSSNSNTSTSSSDNDEVIHQHNFEETPGILQESNHSDYELLTGKINSFLSEDQHYTSNDISNLDESIVSLFIEAIKKHEATDYDAASNLYRQILGLITEGKTDNQYSELLNFFYQLTLKDLSIEEDLLEDTRSDNTPTDETELIADNVENRLHPDSENNSNNGILESNSNTVLSNSDEKFNTLIKDDNGIELEGTGNEDQILKVINLESTTRKAYYTDGKGVTYNAIMVRRNDTINTMPWSVPGHEIIRYVGDLVGQTVRVTKEMTTGSTVWSYVEVPGTKIAGWIDKAGLYETDEKSVSYNAYLVRKADTINVMPWSVPGHEIIRYVGDLVGQTVRVTKEMTTGSTVWSYVEVPGTKIAGWIDKAGLYETDEKSVSYNAYLVRKADTINVMPWSVPGHEIIRYVGDLVGQTVRVTKEMTTGSTVWSYVEVPGTKIAGWIDKAGLYETDEKSVSYNAYLVRKADTINVMPWSLPGHEIIRYVGNLTGRKVRATREITTGNTVWSYVEVPGTNIAGWIDKAGLYEANEKSVNYYGHLIRRTDTLNVMPWSLPGHEIIRYVGDFTGRKVLVLREITTGSTVWSYVEVQGTNVKGWIDSAGILPDGLVLGTTNYKISLNEAFRLQMKAAPLTDKKYAYVSKTYISNNIVTADKLNVRAGAGTNNNIVGQLSNGEKVNIISEHNGWYVIEFRPNQMWVNARPEDTLYYLNPLNFKDDAKQRFQFLDISRVGSATDSDLNRYLSKYGVLNDMGQVFLNAAQKYGVNEIYLLSHAKLETGNGMSVLSRGVNYKGTTVYNVFGIGAVDNDPLGGGTRYAYAQGWTTPEKAIIGGTKFISENYINKGQSTLYKMRWNPDAMVKKGYAANQYATDVGWASKQIYTMYNLHNEIGIKNIILDIPVYE